MEISDGLTIIAILLAPVVAIRIEKWLERQREIKEEKKKVFRILMATRATKLSPDHVQALNMIDLTFTDGKEKPVRDKWKECLDKLANAPKPPEKKTDKPNKEKEKVYEAEYTKYQTELQKWSDDLEDLMAELLQEMGKVLGYDYDKVHIKRGAYIPQEHSDIELEQKAIRKGLVDLLWLRKSLPMEVTYFPGPDEKEAAEQEELRKLLISSFNGEKPLHVKVTKEPED